MQQDSTAAGGARDEADGHEASQSSLDALRREIALLRRTLLKHGHAQELFQDRVQAAMDHLAKEIATSPAGGTTHTSPAGGTTHTSPAGGTTHTSPAGVGPSQPATGGRLNVAQLRSLIELAQAVGNLKDLSTASPTAATEDEDSPRSVREGLDLLGIRVSNLQRSFGLEPIPALGKPFDDRLHRAQGVCFHDDLPDGQVVKELLPGYLLEGEVKRPALVIVNRLNAAERQNEELKATR